MPMVAQKAPYTLFILDDDDPLNPREDYDNFGTMLCWHRRYNLGDKHDYNEPENFLRDILFNQLSGSPDYEKSVYDFLKQGRAEHVKLEYNRSSKEWELLETSWWSKSENWFTASSYSANLKGKDVPDWFLEECLSSLSAGELYTLASEMKNHVILPLYLYDHSGITMNTTGFSCPWDSGQCGWIYTTEEDIQKEYGAVTPETLQRAVNLLRAEVETYDYYLTGQCYGFKLFKEDEEIDSCWGFLGDISDAQKHVKEYLPEDAEVLADSLEYQYDIDEDEYLSQLQELDDENGMEVD